MDESVDVAQLWKDIEDHLAPGLQLSASERSLYYHLLRHSRLVGCPEVRITISGLALRLGFCHSNTRDLLRSLTRKGCLSVRSRSNRGHLLGVKLPADVLVGLPRFPSPSEDAAPLNPVKTPSFREAIFRRDGERCFYCLRKLHPAIAALDHVVPRASGGDDTESNLVACCCDCNAEKGVHVAADFLRTLYRTSRLTAVELDDRLAALGALEHVGAASSASS